MKSQYEKDLEKMNKFAKSMINNKKKALKFLIEAGISTKSGKLTKFYK